MQTITLKTRADSDGIVKLEVPTNFADREIEVVLVMQPVNSEPVDAMGYPIGYFDETYGMFADEALERDQPEKFDVRDELA